MQLWLFLCFAKERGLGILDWSVPIEVCKVSECVRLSAKLFKLWGPHLQDIRHKGSGGHLHSLMASCCTIRSTLLSVMVIIASFRALGVSSSQRRYY